MEPIEIGLWVSGFLLVTVVLGMRVAFAAGLAGLIGLVWIFWAKFGYDPARFTKALTIAVKTAGQVPHSKVSSQALSLIPTFILIGYLAYYAGLTKALFEAAKRWLAWVPGGLAVSTVFATAGFAAVSGASVATSAVFARIAIPEMLKIGYDKRFAAGVVAAGGTLASLIPPSAILVIYAIIVEQDVGKLLLAGFIPGAFSALIYGLLIIGMAMTIKGFGPAVTGFTWRERFVSLPPALPILFVVATIILFVYNPFGGDAWGTPTEGGAIGAFVVFLDGAVSRHAVGRTEGCAAGNGKAVGDDLYHHLGRADLRALSGLCRTADSLFRLDHLADPLADADLDLHPAGLCGAGYVHGCHRYVAADAARGLPSGHGA